jgi:hypothetical protein
MGLKIDKGIPVPTMLPHQRRTVEIHAALNAMEVGDSVEFCLDTANKKGQMYSQEGSRFVAVARRRGIKLTSRRNSEANTVRYWRVE